MIIRNMSTLLSFKLIHVFVNVLLIKITSFSLFLHKALKPYLKTVIQVLGRALHKKSFTCITEPILYSLGSVSGIIPEVGGTRSNDCNKAVMYKNILDFPSASPRQLRWPMEKVSTFCMYICPGGRSCPSESRNLSGLNTQGSFHNFGSWWTNHTFANTIACFGTK